jgi:hypothetical protein
MTLAVAAALLATAGLACDDKSDNVPPEAVAANPKPQDALPPTKPAPTTQELAASPRTKLRLGDLPLTLDVPKDWGLKSSGEGAFVTINLEGMASSGPISIQLSARLNRSDDPYTPATINGTFERLKKETQARPHEINRIEMRDLGPLKVIEQRMISNQDFRGGKTPPEVWGEVEIGEDPVTGRKKKVRAILDPVRVRWNFTVYIPVGKDKYDARSLTFLNLRLVELEKDREFLEQMMKTLAYEE